VATTFDRSDVDGTKRMLHELYDLFEKKTEIVLNKVLNDFSSKTAREDMQAKAKDMYKVPVIGIVPCFCDVLKAEGGVIFANEKQTHPFARILDEIATKIDNNTI
jgi:MinD-like ATPase involved in chromosome partitioning or flagellar assembly